MPTSDPADLKAVMADLKRGFAGPDRAALARAVTDDFEWHTHTFSTAAEQPTGKILRGLDEVMAEIERRQREWTRLRYREMEERYLPDLIVQTFTVSGIDERERAFHTDAVDLYPVIGGRLARKQTYWKQPSSRFRP